MLEELGRDIVLPSPDLNKILRMLQIPRTETADAMLQEQIRLCSAQVLRCSSPRAVFRILPLGEIMPALAGDDIRRLLEGCTEAVLMALTLGSGLEKRLMREEVTNLSNAYVMDVCASQAAEEAADLLERRLRTTIRSSGKYLTNRYSPGYGDFPLETQRMLLEYLNAGRAIGLTLTPSCLLVPRKSITAVLGISDAPKPDVYGGCGHCPLLTKCSWREHGERCYLQGSS